MKALVMVARGLRLQYLGCYGNEWIRTPALDRLAAEGVVFDQHFADRPDYQGFLRSWQTGRLAVADCCGQTPESLAFTDLAQNGVRTVWLADEVDSLPSFAKAGWTEILPAEALASVSERLKGPEAWLVRIDLATLADPSPGNRNDDSLTAAAECEFADCLEPEDAEFLERQEAYAVQVERLDEQIEAILASFQDSDDVLIMVTSDQGAALHRPQHPAVLHEELVHVPLILRLPGRAEAGRHVWALTQPADLLPTLFEGFCIPSSPMAGRSLLPLAQGEPAVWRQYACSCFENDSKLVRRLQSHEWSFVAADESARLYMKPEDRWEVNDVASHYPELCDQFSQELRNLVEISK
jgi:arylsulfatase A-like enzyme